jgi:hypothetical protein
VRRTNTARPASYTVVFLPTITVYAPNGLMSIGQEGISVSVALPSLMISIRVSGCGYPLQWPEGRPRIRWPSETRPRVRDCEGGVRGLIKRDPANRRIAWVILVIPPCATVNALEKRHFDRRLPVKCQPRSIDVIKIVMALSIPISFIERATRAAHRHSYLLGCYEGIPVA